MDSMKNPSSFTMKLFRIHYLMFLPRQSFPISWGTWMSLILLGSIMLTTPWGKSLLLLSENPRHCLWDKVHVLSHALLCMDEWIHSASCFALMKRGDLSSHKHIAIGDH